MIIKNGIVLGEDLFFQKRDVYIDRGRIVAEESQVTGNTVIDAEGLYVIPGLVDVHSHGAAGFDFSDGDGEGLRSILAYQRAHGITTYCPTSMTLPRERLLQVMKSVGNLGIQEKMPSKQSGEWGDTLANIGGIHMEGPFLDPARRGAHRAGDIRKPDRDFLRECDEASGSLLRLVTLAPNVEGAVELIQTFRNEQKIHFSLGHTSADYDTCVNAFAAGADHVTHLFNAMEPLHHREPGLIGAAADTPDCMAELIADGVHVHDSAMRAAFRLFPDRIVLISDSIRATGLADGVYELGGQQVTVKGNRAELADGTIAGSVTNLFDCVRKAVSAGIPFEIAIAAATVNPSRSIGICDQVGSLTPGKRADVLLVDKELRLVRVI